MQAPSNIYSCQLCGELYRAKPNKGDFRIESIHHPNRASHGGFKLSNGDVIPCTCFFHILTSFKSLEMIKTHARELVPIDTELGKTLFL